MEFNIFLIKLTTVGNYKIGKRKLWEKGYKEIGQVDTREMFPDKIDRLLIILF